MRLWTSWGSSAPDGPDPVRMGNLCTRLF